MCLTSIVEAQNEIIGSSIQGSEIGGVSKLPNQLDFWDAGINVNQWGTNVVSWNGLYGSGKYGSWANYSFTNQPTFRASYTTNAFPSIVFENQGANGAENLRNNDLASLVSGANGGQNFTLLLLACSQTNTGINIVSFGSQSASNQNASIMGFRQNASPVTTKVLSYAWDTNQANVTLNLNSGITSNVFTWCMFSSSNGTFNIMENLKVQQSSRPGSAITLNTATLGMLNRTNDVSALFWRGGITCIGFWTNWQEASSMTNNMNYYNSTYRQGFYKVY